MSRDALDFSGQQTLVVGGSTGIGNAVARAFLHHGSTVHVTGTRASASDYRPEEVSDLSSVGYSQLDLGKRSALRDWSPPFSALNTLVLCHAHTKFGGGEYDSDTFRDVVEVNLNSMFDCAERFKPMLAEAKGSVIIVSSLAAFRTIADQPAFDLVHQGRHPGEWDRPRPRRDQDGPPGSRQFRRVDRQGRQAPAYEADGRA
jgi:3-oxoacyl-[acyl-carrier protein] reductase